VNAPASVCQRLAVLLAALALAPPALAEDAGLLGRRLRKAYGLRHDESLSRAAAELARGLSRGEAATLTSVTDALAREGLADAQALPLGAVGTPEAALSAVEAQARASLPGQGATHLGVALVSRGAASSAVLLSVRRLLEVGPIALEPPASGLRFRGQILAGRSPAALLMSPSGAVRRLDLHLEGQALVLEVPFAEGPGPYVLEIQLSTERGPEVAGLWRLRVGGKSEGRVLPNPSHDTPERILPAVNALRAASSLNPLLADPALSRAAEQRAKVLCQSQVARHLDVAGAGPLERARAAGYRGAFLAENLAIAPTLARAHENLLGSPSHRENLLSRRAQRFGLGVATGPDRVCAVELLGDSAQE